MELDGCWPVDKATRERIKDENPPSDSQTLEEVEGNEGHEVRVVRYEGRKMDFYCRTFLVSPAPSLLTDSPAPDTVTLSTHSHSELSFSVSYVDVPSSSDQEKPSLSFLSSCKSSGLTQYMISYDITPPYLPNATSLEYPHFVHSDAQFVRNIATRTPRLISTFLLTLHMYLLFEQHRKNLSPSTLRWGTENGEEHNSESRCDRVDFSNANTRRYSTTG